MSRILGIDVSWCQGKIQWTAVKSSTVPVVNLPVEFAILKCSEAETGVDPTFMHNSIECDARDIPYGAYHVGWAKGSAYDQALRFRHLAKGAKFGVLDIETGDPRKALDFTLEFLEVSERLWGRKPAIYSYPYYLEHMGLPDMASQYPLWIAGYHKTDTVWVPKETDYPLIPKPWTDYCIWQFDGDKGLKLAGSGADVDYNFFRGTVEDFCNLGKPVIVEGGHTNLVVSEKS